MNMKTIVILFTLFLMQNETFAQTVQTSEVAKTPAVSDTTNKVADTNALISESVLTPEQQGFTKFILPDGTIKYMKKTEHMIIEFNPNK